MEIAIGGTESVPRPDEKELDFYQAYYLVQVQRRANHETNRLAVSNFILAGSLVGIGLVAGKDPGPEQVLWPILIGICLVNVLAVLYIRRSRSWVKVHQERAGWALTVLSPTLKEKQTRQKANSDRGSRRFELGRSELLQIGFHASLVAAVSVGGLILLLS